MMLMLMLMLIHMVYSHLHTLMKSVWNNVEPGNLKKFKMLVHFLLKI